MGMHPQGPRSAVAARQVVWAQHMRSHSHGPLDSMSKNALASIQDVDGDEVEALNPGGHAHAMVQPSGGHRAIHGHGGTLSQRAGTLQPQQQMQRSGNADGAESDVSGTLVVHGDGEEDSDALYGDDEHTGPSRCSMHMQMQGQQSHPALWGAGIGPISSQGMQDGMPGEQGATTAGGTHVRGRGSCDLSGPTSEDGTGMDTNCMQERPLSGQGGSATGTLGDGWHSGRQGRFEPSQAARLRRDSLKGTAAGHLARSERELMLLDPKRARRIIANRQVGASIGSLGVCVYVVVLSICWVGPRFVAVLSAALLSLLQIDM